MADIAAAVLILPAVIHREGIRQAAIVPAVTAPADMTDHKEIIIIKADTNPAEDIRIGTRDISQEADIKTEVRVVINPAADIRIETKAVINQEEIINSETVIRTVIRADINLAVDIIKTVTKAEVINQEADIIQADRKIIFNKEDRAVLNVVRAAADLKDRSSKNNCS